MVAGSQATTAALSPPLQLNCIRLELLTVARGVQREVIIDQEFGLRTIAERNVDFAASTQFRAQKTSQEMKGKLAMAGAPFGGPSSPELLWRAA